MSEGKTHFRKAFDSPYLSSADIVEPTTLTVSHVGLEPDHTKKTKDLFNTAHFVEKELRPGEKLKPMILNATNSKTMRNLTGSAFIDDWNNVRVTVYVEPNVKFGRESVEGLRISSKAPPQNSAERDAVVADMLAVADNGSEAFRAAWKELSRERRSMVQDNMDAFKSRAVAADAKLRENEGNERVESGQPTGEFA